MKRIILAIILFFSTNITNAQCIAPTNFTILSNIVGTTWVDWTENGNATEWEIAAIGNFSTGLTPDDTIIATTDFHPFVIAGLPNYPCFVYFIRSICAPGSKSQWVLVATLGCETEMTYFMSTLSDVNFSINERNNISMYPNPAIGNITIQATNQIITHVEIIDMLGYTIQKLNNINSKTISINSDNLVKGIYLVTVVTENGIKQTNKLIKE